MYFISSIGHALLKVNYNIINYHMKKWSLLRYTVEHFAQIINNPISQTTECMFRFSNTAL